MSTSKIVGGTDAAVGSWPWQATVQDSDGYFCGATLISDQWLVTSTRCLRNSFTSYTSLTVYLGDYDINWVEDSEVNNKRVGLIELFLE